MLILKLNFENNKKYYFNIFQEYYSDMSSTRKKKLLKDAFGLPPQLKTKLLFFKMHLQFFDFSILIKQI